MAVVGTVILREVAGYPRDRAARLEAVFPSQHYRRCRAAARARRMPPRHKAQTGRERAPVAERRGVPRRRQPRGRQRADAGNALQPPARRIRHGGHLGLLLESLHSPVQVEQLPAERTTASGRQAATRSPRPSAPPAAAAAMSPYPSGTRPGAPAGTRAPGSPAPHGSAPPVGAPGATAACAAAHPPLSFRAEHCDFSRHRLREVAESPSAKENLHNRECGYNPRNSNRLPPRVRRWRNL